MDAHRETDRHQHSRGPSGASAFRLAVIIAALWLHCAAGIVAAQPADGAQDSAPVIVPPSPWQYGGFVDIGYLRDFNDPSNHLFRSRGTAFHVDEWDLNMAGAYVRKKASEQ